MLRRRGIELLDPVGSVPVKEAACELLRGLEGPEDAGVAGDDDVAGGCRGGLGGGSLLTVLGHGGTGSRCKSMGLRGRGAKAMRVSGGECLAERGEPKGLPKDGFSF